MARRSSQLGIRLHLNISLTLNHVPYGLYGEESRQFLRKGRGESQRHVMMKLLSAILFYHEDLEIEASASQHFKPDLVRLDEQSRPVQWIDCGQTSLQKLDKISSKNKRTFIDIVKATPGELSSYKTQADTRLKHPERVRYWSFSDGLIARLGEICRARHDVVVTITQGYEQIYLVIDDKHELSSEIIWLNQETSPAHERQLEQRGLVGVGG